jgi:hypothetical protein
MSTERKTENKEKTKAHEEMVYSYSVLEETEREDRKSKDTK